MRKIFIVFALFAILFFGLLKREAGAWSATWWNTHEALTTSAVQALDKEEYPDIALFYQTIIYGSSSGFPGKWWFVGY